MEHQLFKVTQNAVIKNPDGMVLILKHTTGNWLLPGGRVNRGEKPIDGLRREIREETGIENFEITKILDADSQIEGGNGTYIVTFLIDVSNASEIKLSNEHIEYAWVGINDLGKYHFWHEDIEKRIKTAFNFNNK